MNLIGTYCIRLYHFDEKHAPFHVMAELKQTAQAKILISQM